MRPFACRPGSRARISTAATRFCNSKGRLRRSMPIPTRLPWIRLTRPPTSTRGTRICVWVGTRRHSRPTGRRLHSSRNSWMRRSPWDAPSKTSASPPKRSHVTDGHWRSIRRTRECTEISAMRSGSSVDSTRRPQATARRSPSILATHRRERAWPAPCETSGDSTKPYRAMSSSCARIRTTSKR